MFAAYPTHLQPASRRLRPVTLGPRPDLAATFALRDYRAIRRLVEDPARLQAILAAYAPEATPETVATATGLAPATVARATAWLLKYHFLEEAP